MTGKGSPVMGVQNLRHAHRRHHDHREQAHDSHGEAMVHEWLWHDLFLTKTCSLCSETILAPNGCARTRYE